LTLTPHHEDAWKRRHETSNIINISSRRRVATLVLLHGINTWVTPRTSLDVSMRRNSGHSYSTYI
jgi:hypothetical protein